MKNVIKFLSIGLMGLLLNANCFAATSSTVIFKKNFVKTTINGTTNVRCPESNEYHCKVKTTIDDGGVISIDVTGCSVIPGEPDGETVHIDAAPYQNLPSAEDITQQVGLDLDTENGIPVMP
jgi:hypothetical protein